MDQKVRWLSRAAPKLARRLRSAGRVHLLRVGILVPLGLAATSAQAMAANAVIPTSSSPGTSASVINNYQQVNFPANDDGTWPCGGGGNASPVCPGPDGESGPTQYPLGFNIDFYGSEFNSAYVNNNGNITFAEPLAEYTPSDLTTFGSPIIAPFFADVDTRGPQSALINFGTGTLDGFKVFVVNWPGVGCYDENSSVLDNFQLILIDRPDEGTGATGDDFDIEFNYDTIGWDTGEASGGDVNCQNGTDGNSAYVGYSNGTSDPDGSYQLAGSGVPNAFLDSNPQTGLVYGSLSSTVLGRYLFTVQSGEPGTYVAPQPPSNTTPPAITGGTAAGSTLTCSVGSWAHSPTGYTYQWDRNGVAIANATNSTYTTGAADQGTTLTCVVTATNAIGSASATSPGVSVPPAPPAVAPGSAPSVSGTPLPGHTLTCNPGSWTGSPTFTYSWQVGARTAAGATASTYVVTVLDEGQTITCAVRGTNAGGSSSATSAGQIVAQQGTLTCPKPTGSVSAQRIGPLALGETQAAARAALKRHRVTRYGFDYFCQYGGWGERGGYHDGRFVLLLTGNPYYKFSGASVGLPISDVKGLKVGRKIKIGLNDWYVARGTSSNWVFKVRGGIIQELGVAVKSETLTTAAQRAFISSFGSV